VNQAASQNTEDQWGSEEQSGWETDSC